MTQRFVYQDRRARDKPVFLENVRGTEKRGERRAGEGRFGPKFSINEEGNCGGDIETRVTRNVINEWVSFEWNKRANRRGGQC